MNPTPAVGKAFHGAVTHFKFRFLACNEKRRKLADGFCRTLGKSGQRDVSRINRAGGWFWTHEFMHTHTRVHTYTHTHTLLPVGKRPHILKREVENSS